MARRIVVITLIFALVLTLMTPLPAPAHDGYPPIPIFVFRTHPDLPFEEYVNGKLGIVLPSYDDLFLFIAYRNLRRCIRDFHCFLKVFAAACQSLYPKLTSPATSLGIFAIK